MRYAHSFRNKGKTYWQPLKTHLEGVADRAGGFATDFNARPVAFIAGLLHDVGKASNEFQQYLEGNGRKVRHSIAGVLEAERLFKLHENPREIVILNYIINGHHGGLKNFWEQTNKLDHDIPDYSGYKDEVSIPKLAGFLLTPSYTEKNCGFAWSFLIRLLFSCLVDADFLDTEKALSPNKSSLRSCGENFDVLSQRFDDHVSGKLMKSDDTTVNRYRKEIYNQCRDAAKLPQQILSLTAPTGSGKTIASMGFALQHLKMHKLKRIIYVEPYTGVVTQTAAQFRKIFGEENVLEHHSNYEPVHDIDDFADIESKLKLAAENWDVPIVVTTHVQFFESLFAYSVSRCRKLHNMAKSVIVIDEVQALPTGFLKPCAAALAELVNNYGSTVLLCTATQPNVGDLLGECNKITEIMRDPQELHEIFRRVRATHIGSISDAELSARLVAHKQVLCIVSTRRHAQNLYLLLHKLLPKAEGVFHLSARMCSAHIEKVVAMIKSRLNKGLECRVISTSLIGVGVDVDFPVVYEEECGLDAACQGAGRGNREGKLAYGNVYVFKSTEGFALAPSQKRAAQLGSRVFSEYESDPFSPVAVSSYFKKLHFYAGTNLDKKNILAKLERGAINFEFPFRDIADAFKIIEQNTRSVIIPYDANAKNLIKQLENTKNPGVYLRKLQRYTVNIYWNEFDEFKKQNAIYAIADRFFVLSDESRYSEDLGLLPFSIDQHDLLIA